MKTIKLSRATKPQREFWASDAKIKAFVGGIGSGKSYAGVTLAISMPRGSVGAILAPTFPMLRDSTLATFLEITEKAGILQDFNQSSMTARLAGNRKVLFKQASDADRLRGMNLGWIYVDEAAMVDYPVYLVLLGRLRLSPGKLWLTTSPLSKSNWIYQEFVAEPQPDRQLIHATTRSNIFLPSGYIETLEAAYDASFAQQELEGLFIDESHAQLIPDSWVEKAIQATRPTGNPGPKVMGVDLAHGNGGDRSVIVVCDRYGVLRIEASNQWDIQTTAKKVKELQAAFGINPSNIVFDQSTGGQGHLFPRYLAEHGLTCVGYHGSDSGNTRFKNIRSRMGHRLRLLMNPELPSPIVKPTHLWNSVKPYTTPFTPGSNTQPPFTLPLSLGENLPLLKREIAALRYLDRNGCFELETKEKMRARLGNKSPDILDSLFMALTKIPEDSYIKV